MNKLLVIGLVFLSILSLGSKYIFILTKKHSTITLPSFVLFVAVILLLHMQTSCNYIHSSDAAWLTFILLAAEFIRIAKANRSEVDDWTLVVITAHICSKTAFDLSQNPTPTNCNVSQFFSSFFILLVSSCRAMYAKPQPPQSQQKNKFEEFASDTSHAKIRM